MTEVNTAPATEAETKTIVSANRENYKHVRSASGAKSLNNGDPVAVAMEGMNIEEVYQLAKRVTGEDFKEKYQSLNVGMQRMNLGNRIRGVVNKMNKSGANPKEGETANPTAGTDFFNEKAASIVEKVSKRLAKETEAKEKAAAEKAKAAEAKAEAKDTKAK